MKKLLLLCRWLGSSSFSRLPAQDRTVTGKVTAADDGDALPGVNVLVRGSTTGTTTDADGSRESAVGKRAAPGNGCSA